MDKTYDQFSSSLDPEEYSHIWNVINFYQRPWITLKHKQLVNSMVPDLFGEVFMRWYIPYFEKMIVPYPKGWSTGRHLKDLKNWFESNSDKANLEKWVELGREDRENIMKRVGLLPDITKK